MQVAIGIVAGMLALLCVVSLVYIYRHQRQAASVDAGEPAPGRRLE
ncbi:hypothetical protein ACFQ2A_08610 [Variovorax dokdonensis]